jgi:hypothetical protein
MKRISSFLAVLCLGLPVALQASNSQSFVSAQHGSDQNSCAAASPCRSFARAIAATASGGEVIVLDSGSYDAVTIGQAVSIEAPAGVYAGIAVTSGDGITIAADATDVVALEGLTVTAAGGHDGIRIESAGTVHVERCAVSGFPGSGIRATDGTVQLLVADSSVRACNFGVIVGVGPGAVSAALDRCRLEDCNVGLEVESGGRASIRDSVVSGGVNGIDAFTNQPSTSAEVNVDDCLVSNNSGDGLSVGANDGTSGGLARVARSTITDNGTGFDQTGAGTLLSHGDNTVEGNGSDDNGVIGSYAERRFAVVVHGR